MYLCDTLTPCSHFPSFTKMNPSPKSVSKSKITAEILRKCFIQIIAVGMEAAVWWPPFGWQREHEQEADKNLQCL